MGSGKTVVCWQAVGGSESRLGPSLLQFVADVIESLEQAAQRQNADDDDDAYEDTHVREPTIGRSVGLCCARVSGIVFYINVFSAPLRREEGERKCRT